MGFGPTAPDVESGVEAVKNLMELLYPEYATTEVLNLFEASARALLTAKAPLTFENINRLWRDPAWRQWIMERWPSRLAGPWDKYAQIPVDPHDLNPAFGALIQDRITASAALVDESHAGADESP